MVKIYRTPPPIKNPGYANMIMRPHRSLYDGSSFISLCASCGARLCIGLVSVRPSVCMSRRSIAGRRQDSRQSATAASVLRCDQRDEDRHRLALLHFAQYIETGSGRTCYRSDAAGGGGGGGNNDATRRVLRTPA